MKAKLISHALMAVSLCIGSIVHAQDRLPSWNDTSAKKAIIAFVERVTKEGSPDFVRPEERIATFDNDGTLWAEKPIYFQFQFAIDRVKALAPQHPKWKERKPLNYILTGNMKALLANEIKRSSLGTKNETLKYNQDGSLTIYVQAGQPAEAQRANWLPAPKNADFVLFMRACWPKTPVIDGTWMPPAVEEVK